MREAVSRFYEFLQRPLYFRARFVLAALVLPLLLSFTAPLWTITMKAPQYQGGLTLDIYAHTIEGGHDGQDLREINILNHYIGMKPLDRAELSDLDWIPFAIGVLAVLTLRAAAIGNVSALIDLMVIVGYFSAFSMARFGYTLYTYGNNLDPNAPLHNLLPSFTPPVIGNYSVANFEAASWPGLGTFYIGAFATGVAALTAYHLWHGRKEAERLDTSGA